MPKPSVWMVQTAFLHLGIGMTFGALMLWNKGLPFNGQVAFLLSPHIELVLVGWVIQLAMGVAFWMMPRFTGEKRYGRVWLVWGAFGLINAGVVVVIASDWIIGASGLMLVGRLLESLAVVLFALHLWPRIKPFGE